MPSVVRWERLHCLRGADEGLKFRSVWNWLARGGMVAGVSASISGRVRGPSAALCPACCHATARCSLPGVKGAVVLGGLPCPPSFPCLSARTDRFLFKTDSLPLPSFPPRHALRLFLLSLSLSCSFFFFFLKTTCRLWSLLAIWKAVWKKHH